MISAIVEGVLMGLFLSVFIGPVFFLLIDTSIKSGVKSAFLMDAGVLLSDLLWIVFLYWGVDKYLGDFLNGPYSMSIAGGVFVIFGFTGLFNSKREKQVIKHKKSHRLFADGFLLNSINPSVALFWLATIGFALQRFNQDKVYLILFFGSIFITLIIIDAFKFTAASRLSKYLNPKRQKTISILSSIVMLGFGVYMLTTSLL